MNCELCHCKLNSLNHSKMCAPCRRKTLVTESIRARELRATVTMQRKYKQHIEILHLSDTYSIDDDAKIFREYKKRFGLDK